MALCRYIFYFQAADMEDATIFSDFEASSLCRAELNSASGRKSLDWTARWKTMCGSWLPLWTCQYVCSPVWSDATASTALCKAALLFKWHKKESFLSRIFFAVHSPDGNKNPAVQFWTFLQHVSRSVSQAAVGEGPLPQPGGGRTRL